MSLKYIIGSPGSGKSTYIYNRIIDDSLKNLKRHYIIIVPEQFTMQTQKELVRLHPDHVIMNIDVLSFNRLAYRVFDELGVEVGDVLEESGKNLVIRKLSMDRKEELNVLGANIDKTGYIKELKSFILELVQYNISPGDFEDVTKNGGFNAHFIKKAEDIVTIYRAYEEFIKDKYITAESLLVRLSEVVEESKMIRDSVVVFDGFTGFTPLQNQLLMTMLPHVLESYVTITIDPHEPLRGAYKDYELFCMSKKMISSTDRICERCGVDVDPKPIICDRNYRFEEDGVIAHIEKNIFRTGDKQVYDCDNASDELTINLLANPRCEIEYVATQIAGDVRDRKYRYKDIAICMGDMGRYRDYVDSIFSKYRIPYYIDSNSETTFSPIIELIRSAFLIYETDFSYETVIQLLRTNLTDINIGEVDMLDNYLSAAKVRGHRAYCQDFTYEPLELKDTLPMINDIRSRFSKPLVDFYDALSTAGTALDISTAVYSLLVDLDVESKIDIRSEELEKEGNLVKSSQYSQIYRIIISILDKIVTLLGQDVIEPKDYARTLLFACEEAKVSTIPAASDVVIIGDIERSRYEGPRVMYFMGVNDGIIPSSPHSTGIISQAERVVLGEALASKDATLAPTDKEKSFMQRFYIYMILAKASSKICITYSASDSDASALTKSYLIDELIAMFRGIKVNVIREISAADYLVTIDSTKRYVSQLLRGFVNGTDADGTRSEEEISLDDIDDTSLLSALIKYCDSHGNNDYESIIRGAFYYHNKEEIERTLYDALVDAKRPRGSVSRLESYTRCAYSYFLSYVLGIKEREQGKLQRFDLGSIYHDILEEFSVSVKNCGIKWKDLDDTLKSEFLDKSCDKVYSEYKRIELLDSPLERYMLEKIKTTMSKTIDSLVGQAKITDYEPYAFEVELDEIASPDVLKMTLRDGRKMKLSGRIDRLDTYNNNGCVYVRIIDYKSGNNTIRYDKIYNGLQLQLIYYLDVAVKGLSSGGMNGCEVKPGAIFYYHVKDPIVEYASDSIDELIKAEMRPSGLFFDDIDEARYEDYISKNKNKDKEIKSFDEPKVLKTDMAHALDKECTGKSLYAPFSYNKDGSLSGSDTKALSLRDIDRLERYIQDKMCEIGSNMYEGEIDCAPLTNDSCKYCPYGGICGFDIRQPGYNYGAYTKMGAHSAKEELFELIGD